MPERFAERVWWAYIRPIGFIRELKQSQKIEAMIFNKENITLHELHVHDGARF